MIVVRDLSSTQEINQSQIKQLAQQRVNDLGGEAFDASELGNSSQAYFLRSLSAKHRALLFLI